MAGVRWTFKEYEAFRNKHKTPEKLPVVSPPEESPPQRILFAAIEARWPGRFLPEVENLVPGRRLRVDLADVPNKLIIELDGYRAHGLSLAGFTKDRERDYLFTVTGWVILRIPAGLVIKDLAAAMERVATFIAARDSRACGAE
jgi:hypothetical protein